MAQLWPGPGSTLLNNFHHSLGTSTIYGSFIVGSLEVLTLFWRVRILFYGCKLFISICFSDRNAQEVLRLGTLERSDIATVGLQSPFRHTVSSKINVTADEIEIDEEIYDVGGVLRRQNGMGLQGWSSSEIRHLCRTLTRENPISLAEQAGRCVRHKQDGIKPKGTGNSCGELACLSVNETAYVILNEAPSDQ